MASLRQWDISKCQGQWKDAQTEACCSKQHFSLISSWMCLPSYCLPASEWGQPAEPWWQRPAEKGGGENNSKAVAKAASGSYRLKKKINQQPNKQQPKKKPHRNQNPTETHQRNPRRQLQAPAQLRQETVWWLFEWKTTAWRNTQQTCVLHLISRRRISRALLRHISGDQHSTQVAWNDRPASPDSPQ